MGCAHRALLALSQVDPSASYIGLLVVCLVPTRLIRPWLLPTCLSSKWPGCPDEGWYDACYYYCSRSSSHLARARGILLVNLPETFLQAASLVSPKQLLMIMLYTTNIPV